MADENILKKESKVKQPNSTQTKEKVLIVVKREGDHFFLQTPEGDFVYCDGSIGPNRSSKIEFFGKQGKKDAEKFAKNLGFDVVDEDYMGNVIEKSE